MSGFEKAFKLAARNKRARGTNTSIFGDLGAGASTNDDTDVATGLQNLSVRETSHKETETRSDEPGLGSQTDTRCCIAIVDNNSDLGQLFQGLANQDFEQLTKELMAASLVAKCGDHLRIERFVYDAYYRAFCTKHQVKNTVPFVAFCRDSTTLLHQSNVLSQSDLVAKFVGEALLCKATVDMHQFAGKVGTETRITALMMCLLWPHTFTVHDYPVTAECKRIEMKCPGLEHLGDAYSADFMDKLKDHLQNADPDSKGKQIAEHRQRRKLQLAQQVAKCRKELSENFQVLVNRRGIFTEESVRYNRYMVDHCTMELFADKHNELCPFCYISLNKDVEYFRYEGRSKKDRSVCQSHVLSKHYLDMVGAKCGADLRAEAVLLPSVPGMCIKLLCNQCDNAQGKWEALIAKRLHCCAKGTCARGPCYVEPSFGEWKQLMNNAVLPSGDAMVLKRASSLFRFFVPNVYRMLLVELRSTLRSYVTWCDLLRQYMYRFLMYPEDYTEGASAPATFYMYVFIINVHMIAALLKREATTDLGCSTLSLGEKLRSLEHTHSMDDGSVGVLINPFVVCLSTVPIPQFERFSLLDIDQRIALPLPDADCLAVYDFVGALLASMPAPGIPKHLSDTWMQKLDNSSDNVELPDEYQLLMSICAYIHYSGREGDLGSGTSACSRAYCAVVEFYNARAGGRLEKSAELILNSIASIDSADLRQRCIATFTTVDPAAGAVFSTLLNHFDRAKN